LYEKSGDDKAYPASTTKIMTCILALENGNLDDEVTVGEECSAGSIPKAP
jgi:D-alanyl-D-alanine carboxypeptidase